MRHGDLFSAGEDTETRTACCADVLVGTGRKANSLDSEQVFLAQVWWAVGVRVPHQAIEKDVKCLCSIYVYLLSMPRCAYIIRMRA